MMDDALPLKDIHLPPEPSFWPLAPGWWLLLPALAVGVPLIIGGLRWWLPRLRRMRRRRDRSRQWFATMTATEDPLRRLQMALELARRCALDDDPRTARLHGADWLALLVDDRQNEEERTVWVDRLASLPFQKSTSPAEADALIDLLRNRVLRGFG
ncbi:DUF4381 domain-containing protein [Pseudomarimonas arenosa]|uniref:DUF4381 domain-containing protein n=1 Tax=Pseudomarimonas arenosa TaxID=2774145 RepID=A0AAW3ZG29_9GAMM|nr:DUF4381 domain-containing protein [Pseudomarimonas arenosa]MBD8525028.1 DUF4381 domain-containing protein [Pseudomarimonas arenosa]